MRYITPLKAARGTGAAGPSTGTLHHWVLTAVSYTHLRAHET